MGEQLIAWQGEVPSVGEMRYGLEAAYPDGYWCWSTLRPFGWDLAGPDEAHQATKYLASTLADAVEQRQAADRLLQRTFYWLGMALSLVHDDEGQRFRLNRLCEEAKAHLQKAAAPTGQASEGAGDG